MRARLLVLAAAVLFSTGGAAIKSTTLTAWQVASFRSGIAALAVLAMLRGARRLPDRATWLVGIVYAATLVFFVVANKNTTAANAIYLQGTAPLYILLAAPLLLREPVGRADIVFMAALGLGLGAFSWARSRHARRRRTRRWATWRRWRAALRGRRR
jgi:drug/metabolite transporter (DMT)-like permease